MNTSKTAFVLIIVLLCDASFAARYDACAKAYSPEAPATAGGAAATSTKKSPQLPLPEADKLISKKFQQIKESKEDIEYKIRDIEYDLRAAERKLENKEEDSEIDFDDGEGYGWFSMSMSFLTAPYRASKIKPKPLSKSEINELETKIAALKARLKRAEALKKTIELQYEAAAKEELASVIKKVKAFTKNPEFAAPLRDNLSEISVRTVPKENKISLLVGHRDAKINPAILKEVLALVEKAVSKKYYVVHDAQSPYAPYIAKQAGSLNIAVSGVEGTGHKDPNSVVIENDFMRMKTFSDSHMVITDPQSLTGLGLLLEGDATVLLDPAKSLSLKDLDSWERDLRIDGRNLGVKLNLPVRALNAQEIISPKRRSSGGLEDPQLDPVKKPQKFYQFKIEDLPIDYILKITEEASGFAQVMRQNDGTQGAVVFGSSSYSKESDPLLYQSVYRLGRQGYAIATGGGGGAMDIANSAAYDSGAISIGVPIGGKNALDNEKNFVSKTQTLEIRTSGYEQRIPVLLSTRKFVIIAPGGSGTVKEIATTFAMLGARDAQVKKVIFLDGTYYLGLLKALVSTALPESLMGKLGIVTKKEDLEAIGQQFQDSTDISRIQSPRAPDLYTLPKKKEKEKKSYSYTPRSSGSKSPGPYSYLKNEDYDSRND